MGESDGSWGELVEHDNELAETWDGFARLPEPGDSPALDAFVERKRITINSLVRVGARLASDNVLAFAAPGGLKFRDIVSDQRWSYAGSEWREMKIVRRDSSVCLVAEGETDGARLSDGYPDCDVAIMPAGAGYFPDTYAAQLAGYERVLVALDTDHAGERGSASIIERVPTAERFAPPANDWCEATELPPVPPPPEHPRLEAQYLVSAADLLELEPPPVISWFENALLPVAGQLVIHGWAKSFKSFLALDLMAALAQGQPWCGFEPTEEPCRVAVAQYEIVWAYYQQRVRQLRAQSNEPELFDQNFMTVTPLRRPPLMAGNTEQEDAMLRALVDADIQVFLLDPVRRATGYADLNSEQEVRPLLNFFARLQDEGITVVTCHHDNKTASRSGGGDPLGMTGAGSFAGDADTIVSVGLPKGRGQEDTCRNVHFTLRNAPGVAPRGFEMTDSGLVYSTTPHGDGMESDDSGPSI